MNADLRLEKAPGHHGGGQHDGAQVPGHAQAVHPCRDGETGEEARIMDP